MDYDFLVVEDSDERMKKLKQFLIGFSYLRASTALEAINLLQKNSFKWLMLDHDLAEEHYDLAPRDWSKVSGTGQDVADWVAEHSPELEGVIIHSLNPSGGKNMQRTLERWGYRVEYRPGCWDYRYGPIEKIIEE